MEETGEEVPDPWSMLTSRQVFDKIRGSTEGISQHQLVSAFEDLKLSLSQLEVAGIFAFANTDGDLELGWEEFDRKFAIPPPVAPKKRKWTCKNCKTNPECYDQQTGQQFEFDEDVKNCPWCGGAATWPEPDPPDNALTVVMLNGELYWCCTQGEACAAQAAWGGFKNRLHNMHCELCEAMRPGM